MFLFQIQSQSAFLSYSGVKPSWRSQTQSIIVPGSSEGLKSAATSRSLGNQRYQRYRWSGMFEIRVETTIHYWPSGQRL